MAQCPQCVSCSSSTFSHWYLWNADILWPRHISRKYLGSRFQACKRQPFNYLSPHDPKFVRPFIMQSVQFNRNFTLGWGCLCFMCGNIVKRKGNLCNWCLISFIDHLSFFNWWACNSASKRVFMLPIIFHNPLF